MAIYSNKVNIFRVIKSRRVGWAGHVARVVERRVAYGVLVGKPEENRPLEINTPRCADNIEANQ